jgi:hypothetical protein
MVSRELNNFLELRAKRIVSHGCHCSANVKRVRVMPYRIFVFRELRSLDDFSPKSLSEQHAEALERALWTAIRKLKERVMRQKELVDRRKRNKGEDELKKRLESSLLRPEMISSSWAKFWSGFSGRRRSKAADHLRAPNVVAVSVLTKQPSRTSWCPDVPQSDRAQPPSI